MALAMKTRPKSPAIEARPGEGHADPIGDQLETIADAINAIDDDPYSDDLKPACGRAQRALVDVHAFLWNLADSTAARVKAQAGFARAMRNEAGANVPKMGHGAPQDYQAAVSGAVAAVDQKAALIARDGVLAEHQDEATQLATAAVEVMKDLDAAIDSAAADYAGPTAFRSGADNSIESHIKQVSAATELKVIPPARSLAMFEGIVERGENEKAEAFMTALRPSLSEWRTFTDAKLSALWAPNAAAPARDGAGREHRTAVFALLNAFDAYRRQTTPPSIGEATKILAALRGVFGALLGVNVATMSRSEFQSQYLDGTAGLTSDPLRIDPKWAARVLPPQGAPTGWSPRGPTTRGGAPTRLPKGAR